MIILWSVIMFCIRNVLMQNVNAPESSEEEELALKILTIIGSILSMIGLVITILTMLIFKYVHGILLLITLFFPVCMHTYKIIGNFESEMSASLTSSSVLLCFSCYWYLSLGWNEQRTPLAALSLQS